MTTSINFHHVSSALMGEPTKIEQSDRSIYYRDLLIAKSNGEITRITLFFENEENGKLLS